MGHAIVSVAQRVVQSSAVVVVVLPPVLYPEGVPLAEQAASATASPRRGREKVRGLMVS
jgi:hypothetical protein